jgi:hypothetical protein
MDDFWQQFRILAYVFAMANICALVGWWQFMYEPKALKKNEQKRKRANRIHLCILLIVWNSVPVYMLIHFINSYS